MPINISGSVVTSREVREYEYNSIVKRDIALHLDSGIFNTVTGTTWFDFSGNGNNGTLTNGPTFNTSNGGSIVLDGSNDYVALGTPTTLNILGNITILAWVKLTSFPVTSSLATIYEKGYNGTSEQTFFRVNTNGLNITMLQVGTFNNTGGEKLTSLSLTGSSANLVELGEWVHLTGQYDTTTWKLFVNGNLESSTVTNQGPYTSTSVSSIGAAFISSGFERFLTGNVANIAIHNTALTSDEILHNYNLSKHKFGL